MVQLSIAVAILFGAMLCVYAVERVWFRQRRGQAISIAVLAASAGEGGIVLLPLVITLLVLLIPVACVCFVQKQMFGLDAAEKMQPLILLGRICAVLECTPTR